MYFSHCQITHAGHVKLWRVKENLHQQKSQNQTDFSADLRGHTRKALGCFFHPTAADVLVSSGADNTVRVWDLQQAAERICIKGMDGYDTHSHVHAHAHTRTQKHWAVSSIPLRQMCL